MIIGGNFLTRGVARFIDRWARRIVERRPPDFVIGGAEDPYLKRWYVLPRNRWGNVYLHEYHRPDDDEALHDHPWRSFSLCLSGRIIDISADDSVLKAREAMTDEERAATPLSVTTVDVHPGDVALRSAHNAHRIDLPTGEIGQRTLFVMGPRVREWGFWCPRGWKDWKDFTAHKKTGDSSRVGAGCE